jgi:hypothetical protein
MAYPLGVSLGEYGSATAAQDGAGVKAWGASQATALNEAAPLRL